VPAGRAPPAPWPFSSPRTELWRGCIPGGPYRNSTPEDPKSSRSTLCRRVHTPDLSGETQFRRRTPMSTAGVVPGRGTYRVFTGWNLKKDPRGWRCSPLSEHRRGRTSIDVISTPDNAYFPSSAAEESPADRAKTGKIQMCATPTPLGNAARGCCMSQAGSGSARTSATASPVDPRREQFTEWARHADGVDLTNVAV